MSHAERSILATHEGESLLSEEGMKAVRSLVDAHEAYGDMHLMHREEVNKLTSQINELEERRQNLVGERDSAVALEDRNRHEQANHLDRAVATTGANNRIYAAVLRATVSGQGSFWFPNTLANADAMGRSYVALDKELRGNRKSQPVLVVEREKSKWRNLYLGHTKRLGGLKPTTVEVEEQAGICSRYTVKRDALQIPVAARSQHSYQIHPHSFGGEDTPLDKYKYDRGPRLTELKDAFKILLPEDNSYSRSRRKLGQYDTEEGISYIEGVGTGSFGTESIFYAIGTESVRSALDAIQSEFEQEQEWPCTKEMFDKLGKLVLGKNSRAISI